MDLAQEDLKGSPGNWCESSRKKHSELSTGRQDAEGRGRERRASARCRQALRVFPLQQGAQVRKLGGEELRLPGEAGGGARLPLAPPMGTLECVPGVSLVRWGPSGQGRRRLGSRRSSVQSTPGAAASEPLPGTPQA